MKRIMIIVLLCTLVMALAANINNRQVPMDQIMQIARDFTSAMWGEETLYPAEPIPLYGPDDKIIAWEINFAFRGPSPDLELLKDLCDEGSSISRDAGFGVNDYAYVIIGATRDMPAIFGSAKSLSHNIVQARKIEREAAKSFRDGFNVSRIYHFGLSQVWTQVTDGKENKYVNPYPSPTLISESDFRKLAAEEMFWENDDFDEEWDSLLAGISNLRNQPVWIPAENKMPFYEWVYGCTPTAAAMIFAWWDHHRGAAKLNAYHFTRHENGGNGLKYHVPNTARILAEKMNTDSSGGTAPQDQAVGMHDAAEVWDYSSSTGSMWLESHSSTTLYNYLKSVIDAQIPALTGIGGHSVAAVGYWDSTLQWAYHDSNRPSLETLHRANVKRVFWIDINVNDPQYFELVQPDGGKRWGHNTGGEVLVSGAPYEIIWEPHSQPNTHVEIWYHVEGGHPTPSTWEVLTTNAPNTGTFNWMVPDINSSFGTTSEYCRVRIRLMNSTTNTLLAEDGSYGNFTITDIGDGMPWVQSYNYTNTARATFAGVDYDPDAQWFVVGMRGQHDQWSVELYENTSFLDLTKRSQYQANANYIVINYQELTNPSAMGVKFRSMTNKQLAFNAEGFTPKTVAVNTVNNKVHPANKAVDIYQVYLPQGMWYFDFGQTNLGFALYKAEGNAFYAFNEAKAWSRDSSGAPGGRSFAYNVTTAGWYALVVNSLSVQNSNFKIEIRDQVRWTGATSTDWFNASNWTSPIVPNYQYDVIIPASATSQPTISGGTMANVKSLSIEAGATLTVSSGTLTVDEDMHISGGLNMVSPGTMAQVWCNGTVNIGPSGELLAITNSRFHCNGDWSSAPGSRINMVMSSELRIGSYRQSGVYNSSTDFSVINLIIQNYSGGTVTLHGPASGVIDVLGTLTIFAGSKLLSQSDGTLSVTNLSNNGNIQMDMGTLKMRGGAGVFPNNATDYFHNVEINSSGAITLERDLIVNGNIILSTGSLSPGNKRIYIKGNWTAASAANFVKGTGNVIFNGIEPQSCNGTSFYILTIMNDVHFTGSDTYIDKYQWYSGAMHLSGGSVIVHDLIAASITGKYVVNSGLLYITQVGGSTDMNADITINGGEMRIMGGYSTSNWAQSANARLVMTGGILDFAQNGISIPNTSNTMDMQISGGLIRTVGNFQCLRPGFTPSAGALELYGSTDASFSIHPQSYINDLVINKQNRTATEGFEQGNGDRTNNNSRVFVTTNSTIQGSLMHQAGEIRIANATFTINGEAEINAKLIMSEPNSKLKVKHTLYWNNTSGSALIAGSIELQNSMEIASGSLFQMGINTSLKFYGISSAPDQSSDIGPGENYAFLLNNASGTRFGNLIIDKVEDSYGNSNFEILASNPITILGNMSIQGQTNLTVKDTGINLQGNLVMHSATTLEDNAVLMVDGSASIYSTLQVHNHALVQVNGNFNTYAGSELLINDHGIISLNMPYNATMFNLSAGSVHIGESAGLEIMHNGLQIGADNFYQDGGTIKIGWAFRAMNPNTFTGNTGRVEFIGARSGQIEMHSSNSFYDLVINKPGISYAVMQVTTVVANRDIIIQGGNLTPMNNILRTLRDLRIEGGRLTLATGSVMQVSRNWINTVGTSAFDEGTGTVQFIDTGNQNSIIPSETFHNLVINKSVGRYAEVPNGATVIVKGSLNIVFRKLILNPGCTVKLNNNSSLLIGNEGELYSVGTESLPITINADNGYYGVQTYSGSKISARYTIFERMNASGINLAAGSIVDPNHPFSYCTFRNAASGGTLIKKYNSQNLTVDNAIFPANTWSGQYNVYHAAGAGLINFRNAEGGFSGAAYEDDPDNRITWTTVQTNPYWAHSPMPSNNAAGVPSTTSMGFTYTSVEGYPDPIGYLIRMGQSPTMETYSETYLEVNPGTHTFSPTIPLFTGNTYYWQVIPTTLPSDRYDASERALEEGGRGHAQNCPIWNFTVSDSFFSSFPYNQNFEAGNGGWIGGSISGTNVWQWGESTQFGAFSGQKIWATMLNANYPHNANSWLRSPGFDFSAINNPMFRVWLNIKTELNWDGMILEYSLDGNTWIKVTGDTGFYNNTSTSGPLAPPKWSGNNTTWTAYTTSIPALAGQAQAFFRFRFVSDSSVDNFGIGVEDIEIWEGSPLVIVDWNQDFTGLTSGSLPPNWTSSTGNWAVMSSNLAGGTAPEMRFNWSPQFTGTSYLTSSEISTVGNSNLTLSFRHMINHYSGPYTLKLLSIVGTTEYLLREWVNPSASVQAEMVTHTITAAQGAGAPNLKIAWVFSGSSYNINQWYIDDVILKTPDAAPTVAHSPGPHHGAANIPINTIYSWVYDSQAGHEDPIGFKLRIGTSPTMSSYTERYIAGGVGFHTWESDISLLHDTQYYWQVIPTSSPGRGDTFTVIDSPERNTQSSATERSDAIGCPIWNFTTVTAEPIAHFPYYEHFESGPRGWVSGANSGNNHWQLGYPNQSVINQAYGGANAWMTYLNQNYENMASTWLKSPPFNFSNVNSPNLSVWLNIWSENSFDGTILEYSLDNSTWQQVTGDTGFYNGIGNMSLYQGQAMWTGQVYGVTGIWTQYSTGLAFLANQEQVWFRFLFRSDSSIVSEGIAVDDFRIWDTIAPPAHAHSPHPTINSIDVPMQTNLGWSYTSQTGFTDPVVYQIRMSTDPNLSYYDSTILWGGPGNHSINPFINLEIGQTYYWQVIPSANADSYRGLAERSDRQDRASKAESDGFDAASIDRDTAINCPIWNFTMIADSIAIATYPYFEDFESGTGGWKSGSISGFNNWQRGTPAQATINNAFSGSNAWMTGLGMNYMNNANIWLRSPLYDFSSLSEPMFSVRIRHKSQQDLDGMILEASIDGGNSWNYVSGDTGFYNDNSGSGTISSPKWSGNNGGWTLYSTSLQGLAFQPEVRLRFRFASDGSVVDEGFAIDDIRIWNVEYPAFSITPASHDFGRVEVGENSYMQYFQISNTGGGILHIDPANIILQGMNPNEFELYNLSAPVNLSAGQTALISIRFAPLAVGNKEALIRIVEGNVRGNILGLNSRSSTIERDIHMVQLNGFAFQNVTMNLPYYESFVNVNHGNLPSGWESDNPNWWVSSTNQAGYESPEMYFGFDPHFVGEVTLLSPLFDTGGISQLPISFKHRVDHLAGTFDLKIFSVVGSVSHLIDEWMNVDADIASQSMNYQLNTANHGVGANNLRLAFLFSGNSHNINGWYLDDLVLGGSLPIVQTGNATEISHYAANLNANISSTGGLPIFAKGFYYGSTGNPLAEGTEIFSESLDNSYSVNIDELEPGSTIYYIAFADNPWGRAFGSVQSFNTLLPQISINPSTLPAFGETIVNNTSPALSFVIEGTNLLGNVHLSAPANFFMNTANRDRSERMLSELVLEPQNGSLVPTTINVYFVPTTSGTYSGEIVINSTLAGTQNLALSGLGIELATVSINPIANITLTSASGGGNVTADGAGIVTNKGLCWSLEANPDITNWTTSDGDGLGVFSSQMSNLQPGTLYYVRAYATNGAGTAYSSQLSFTTLFTPVISINPTTIAGFGNQIVGSHSSVANIAITANHLTANLSVNAPSGFQIKEAGSESSWTNTLNFSPISGNVSKTIELRFSPIVGGSHTGNVVFGSTGAQSKNLAVSGTGILLPQISTNAVSSIGTHSAISGGNISSDGYSPISACGICWSTNPEPTLADESIAQVPVNWNYTLSMTNLNPNSTYYVRAYAVNEAGIAYGEQQIFNTLILDLQAPQNPVLTIIGNTVSLSWDAVPNALTYKIYQSSDPNSTDWGSPIANTGSTFWSGTVNNPRSFYKVKAAIDIVR